MAACKNCDFIITNDAQFCPNCGQTVHIHRLNLKHIFHDLVHVFTHADKGIFFTIKELALKPGQISAEYVEGKRKKYFNPFQFVIIAGGVFTFLAIYFKIFTNAGGNVNTARAMPAEIALAVKEITTFFSKYFNLIIICFIPLQALLSWLLFYKSKRNYAENLVLNAYFTGEMYVIQTIILTVPSAILPKLYYVFVGFNMAISILYFGYAAKFFYKTNYLAAFAKAIIVRGVTAIVTYKVIEIAITLYLKNKFSH